MPRTPHSVWDEPANVQMLGTMPDTEIARRLGVEHPTVRRARIRLGISAYIKPPDAPPRRRVRTLALQDLPDEIRSKLGRMSDAALAALSGFKETAIRRVRMDAGIAPFGPTRPPMPRIEVPDLPEPTPLAIAMARSAAGHNQTQASMVARYSHSAWGRSELGVTKMARGNWELYLLMTDQHPTLRVVPREP